MLAEASTTTNDATFRRVVSLNDGTAGNEIYLGIASGGAKGFILASSATQASYNMAAWSGYAGIAIRWEANSVNAAFKGNAQTVDTAATIPTVTRLDIGNLVGSSFFTGTIRRIVYWPAALSDNALQNLTA